MQMGMRLGTAAGLALTFASVAAAANQATITDVQVLPKVNRSTGGHYLSVKFVVNVEEYITARKSLQINAVCKAGDRTLRADSFTGVSVRGLRKGDAKDGSAVLFMSERVRDEIEDCRLRFELHELGRKYGDRPLSVFCYRGGKVSAGTCE
jgi:hypothetical protein